MATAESVKAQLQTLLNRSNAVTGKNDKTLTDAIESLMEGGGGSGGASGSYELQVKSITPSRETQTVTPDSGYYGLSRVIADPIPNAFQDVSGVTAKAEHLVAGEQFVNAAGETVAGTMENNGEVSATINGLTVSSVDIPKGFTSGGKISLTGDIESKLSVL